MSIDFYVDNGTAQIRAVYMQANERVRLVFQSRGWEPFRATQKMPSSSFSVGLTPPTRS